MLIRLARAEEYAAVGELTVAAYVADGLLTAEHWYAGELRAAQKRAEDAELLVAVDHDDTLLGTVTFCTAESRWAEIAEPGEAEFRMLAVAPTARRRGVGEALTRWCLDKAHELGVGRVAISSHPAMAAAHRMYDRLGFVRRPERDWEPEPGVRLIALTLDLTGDP